MSGDEAKSDVQLKTGWVHELRKNEVIEYLSDNNIDYDSEDTLDTLRKVLKAAVKEGKIEKKTENLDENTQKIRSIKKKSLFP